MRTGCRFNTATVALLTSCAGLFWSGSGRSQQVAPTRNVYSFPAGYNQSGGIDPSSDLAADAAGDLYGVTFLGGSAGNGTIYKLVPPAAKGQTWTQQTLFDFANAADSRLPLGKPLLDAAGNIYGVTLGGGSGNDGTVWRLSPPASPGGQWVLTVLHSFTNPTNHFNGGLGGARPWSGLVMDRSGTLYGTTADGGTYGWGVAFALTPPPSGGTTWTETVLHNFGGTNNGGQLINAPLTLSNHDTTLTGVSPFLSIPNKGLADSSGLIYRLRRDGSGWKYSVLHRFNATNNLAGGSVPSGGLVVDRNDNLFGITGVGGNANLGIVYELSPPGPGQTAWTEQVLHSFAGPEGENPDSGLVAGGLPTGLFGTTSGGGQGGAVDGSSGSNGVVFKLAPPASGNGPWTYTALHAFDYFVVYHQGTHRYKYVGQSGNLLNGLTFGPNRFLFGVATEGGQYNSGTVFAQSPH